MGTLNAKDSRQGGYQLSRLVAKEVFRQLGNFPARRAVVVLKLTQASEPSRAPVVRLGVAYVDTARQEAGLRRSIQISASGTLWQFLTPRCGPSPVTGNSRRWLPWTRRKDHL